MPLIVMVFDDQLAVTPMGKPVAVPMPVAPVVLWVMLGNTVLMHRVGVEEAASTVLLGVTITLPMIGLDSQLVVVFFTVRVNEIELPEAALLKVTLMGLDKSASVTPTIPISEMEYLLGDWVGLV